MPGWRAAAAAEALSRLLFRAGGEGGHVAGAAGSGGVPAGVFPYEERGLGGERAHPLAGWTAEALEEMPEYYIMDRGLGMAATVAPHIPEGEAAWLTEGELAVYAEAYGRTGFQGGLNWYRCRTEGWNADLEVFAGRRIEVPALFVAGRRDWGMHQVPGALERMLAVCPRMGAPVVVEGAGHWVQQERPGQVVSALLGLVRAGALTGSVGFSCAGMSALRHPPLAPPWKGGGRAGILVLAGGWDGISEFGA